MEALPDPKVAKAISEYFEKISSRDLDGWLELFAEDSVSHDPVGAPPLEGSAGLREEWKILTAPFEKLTLKAESVFYCGIGAAAKWVGEGSGVGAGDVRFEGITVFELDEEGRIQTVMAYWDPAAMMIAMAGEEPAN